MSNFTDNREMNSPFVTAVITLIATIVGAFIGSVAERRSADMVDAASARQRQLDVAKYKGDILRSLKDFDRDTAEALLVHTLKPIDSTDAYQSFYNDYQNLLAKLQLSKDTRASSLGGSAVLDSVQASGTTSDPKSLVALFPEDLRYRASRELAELYQSQPGQVVDALLSGIQPPEARTSYRVNLYIAYTLARIRPNWSGTPEQLGVLMTLKTYPEYDDPTFRARVDEAANNFRPKRQG